MTIELFSGTPGIPLIIVQIAGAVSPFIVSYLFYRYMKALRFRMARKYFEEVKASEYWPEISKRKFMQESEIYAYDFEELVAPGEHFLHPCIRGLRERQMYEELPGLEKIRTRFCWSIRVLGVVWVASFFAAFYFSALSLKSLGDETGYLSFALQTSAIFVVPFGSGYLLRILMTKQLIYNMQEYLHHVKNSKHWQDIIHYSFMQDMLRKDPELKMFGAPPSPHATGASWRLFLRPCRVRLSLSEERMYENIPEIKQLCERYCPRQKMLGWISFFAFIPVCILSVLVLGKIGMAVGIQLTIGY